MEMAAADLQLHEPEPSLLGNIAGAIPFPFESLTTRQKTVLMAIAMYKQAKEEQADGVSAYTSSDMLTSSLGLAREYLTELLALGAITPSSPDAHGVVDAGCIAPALSLHDIKITVSDGHSEAVMTPAEVVARVTQEFPQPTVKAAIGDLMAMAVQVAVDDALEWIESKVGNLILSNACDAQALRDKLATEVRRVPLLGLFSILDDVAAVLDSQAKSRAREGGEPAVLRSGESLALLIWGVSCRKSNSVGELRFTARVGALPASCLQAAICRLAGITTDEFDMLDFTKLEAELRGRGCT